MAHGLPARPAGWSFGADIDAVHRQIFRADRSRSARVAQLRAWLAAHQPCVFGRLAMRGKDVRGLRMDVCLVDEDDRAAGPDAVVERVRTARLEWKDAAAAGLSSGFVVWLVDEELATAEPSAELSRVVRELAGLCYPEWAPVEEDVVYTEAVPLRLADGRVGLFKASVQLFLSAAHRHANHDRRFPGGVAFVVNGPGHYGVAAAQRKLFADLATAVRFVRRTAERSIGGGGIGHPGNESSSWHSSGDRGLFSARYQVDVLVGSALMRPEPAEEVWDGLHLDYISDREVERDDPDFGWFRPLPVPWEQRYAVPWPPRAAYNDAAFNY
jgi:hypothetical protein